MIIGILQTDRVKPEFSQRFGEYPAMFRSLLLGIDAGLGFRVYDVRHGVYPEDMDQCDAYITTGSRASVYQHDPWIEELRDFIVQLDQRRKKLVAVCFGHQLVAQTFGGHTERSERGWGVGVHRWRVTMRKRWMMPPLPAFRLIVSHQDQVTRLPDGAELLAGSDFCPIAMYQRGEHTLAIQGHPEFGRSYAESLMRHRQDLLGEAVFNDGIRSLRLPTDETTVARWILTFIAGEEAGGGPGRGLG